MYGFFRLWNGRGNRTLFVQIVHVGLIVEALAIDYWLMIIVLPSLALGEIRGICGCYLKKQSQFAGLGPETSIYWQ
jgi:hypothetical protein